MPAKNYHEATSLATPIPQSLGYSGTFETFQSVTTWKDWLERTFCTCYENLDVISTSALVPWMVHTRHPQEKFGQSPIREPVSCLKFSPDSTDRSSRISKTNHDIGSIYGRHRQEGSDYWWLRMRFSNKLDDHELCSGSKGDGIAECTWWWQRRGRTAMMVQVCGTRNASYKLWCLGHSMSSHIDWWLLLVVNYPHRVGDVRTPKDPNDGRL